MKKFLLALVAMVMVAGVSAQNWSIGGRVGSGVQVVGQYDLNKKNYLEGRFGAAWLGGVTADFTALYNWKICTMDWTPNGGDWFFDAGVGVNVGGASHYAYVGIAGMARLGYNFRKELVNKIGIESLRLFLNGNNLFCLDNVKIVDPETENMEVSRYPSQRAVTLGLQIGF